MKLEEIDENLKVETAIDDENLTWVSAWQAPILVCGLCPDDRTVPFHRMPQETARAVSAGVEELNWHTAGGRLRFATDSGTIAIQARMPETVTMPHMPKSGQSGFDLYECREGRELYAGTFMPPEGVTAGYSSVLSVPPGLRTFTIHFPLYDGVETLALGLEKTARLEAPEAYLGDSPIVYYGSSITQGGCASRPGNCYQAMIARMLHRDYLNFGFSGSALGEEAMAAYLASVQAAAFVCDYDYNAADSRALAETHSRFFSIYREKQPRTPVIFVTKHDFRQNNPEDLRRRDVIYETYRRARQAGDRHVYFLDGRSLMEGPGRWDCTVDGAHPNDLGFFRMAMVIGGLLQEVLGSRA